MIPTLLKVKQLLGPLELTVMQIVWKRGKSSVREVLLDLRRRKTFAYTTIMTVMDNLYKKGFVTREKIQRAYYYSPVIEENYVVKISLAKVFKDLTMDYGKRKVLFSVFSTSVLPKINIKFNSPYSTPIGYGISLTLLLFLFGLSLSDLGQNLSFFGTFDYLKLLTSDLIFSLDRLPVYIFALFESLPIINIFTTIVSFTLLVILVKKLSNLGGSL